MLASFDFETTGLIPGTHGILALAVVLKDGRHFSRRIFPHPTAEYQQEAIDKNGYNSGEWLKSAVTLTSAMTDLKAFLPEDVKPLAHGKEFDSIWLKFAERESGIKLWEGRKRWACSQAAYNFLMDAGVLPEASASLDSLGKVSGYFTEDSPRQAYHEALEDAACCLISYQWMMSLVKPKTLWQRFLENLGLL